jgi:hypothetical protein
MARYLRLRQICLVAADLERAVGDLADVLGIEVCHRDPNVARYGLVNALLAVGTSFIEVVAPKEPGGGTAAGRYLQRRGGDGGYMVIMDCEDVAPRRAHIQGLGVRLVEDRAYAGKAFLMQLHPRDTGGAIMEIDHHIGGEALDGAYQWAGEHWQPHIRTERTTAITGAELQSDTPAALAAKWAGILERPTASERPGEQSVRLDNATLRFVPAADGRGEGLGGVDIAVRDAGAVREAARRRGLALAGDAVTICGTRFNLRPASTRA